MSAALMVLLCIAGCSALALAPLPSSDTTDPHSSRGRAQRRAEVRLAVSVLLVSCGLMGTLYWLGHGTWRPALPLLGALLGVLLLVHPWILVRWVAIPLGLVRTAWALSRLGGVPWVRDPEGGAVLAGTLAALRRAPSESINTWLRARLAVAPVRGAGLVAAGLLAADLGDRETARMQLRAVDLLDPDLCPPLARRIAMDWLVADAAHDGRWDALVDTANAPSMSRTTRFVALAARRLRGEAIGGGTLVRRWLATPRRLRTMSLLGRALRVDTRALDPARLPIGLAAGLAVLDLDSIAHDGSAANDGGTVLSRPLALHAEALLEREDGGREARLSRLAAAWDGAFADFDLRRRIRERANALDARVGGELAVARLQREAAADLAAMLRTIPELVAAPSRTMSLARERLGDDLLDELTHACVRAHVARRPTGGGVLAAWHSTLVVMQAFERLVEMRNAELSRHAYAIVEVELRQTAAWFWNETGQRVLANAICTWLLLEAERVDDRVSAAYHRHNAALVV